jgi:hypothetical protein
MLDLGWYRFNGPVLDQFLNYGPITTNVGPREVDLGGNAP